MDDHYDEELRRLASGNNPEPRRPLSDYIISQAELSEQDTVSYTHLTLPTKA